MKTSILGHRGAMGERPENTEISFKKALADGADGVEFDVHLTADGIPVVIHDEKVDRTTGGSGSVRNMSLAEIKRLDAGNEEYRNQEILTLEETLNLVGEESKLINIELKQGPIFYQGLEEKVLTLVNNFGIMDKVVISSFNHYSIKSVKDSFSEAKCGLLYMAGIYQPWVYAESVGAEAIHPFVTSINQELVEECHNNNIQVNVFGVNTKDSISKLIKIGVDGIITDYPLLAIDLRE